MRKGRLPGAGTNGHVMRMGYMCHKPKHSVELSRESMALLEILTSRFGKSLILKYPLNEGRSFSQALRP